ncbi:MAG: hypothetical protein ACTSRZ_21330 [Promethearchaeota archaeon]
MEIRKKKETKWVIKKKEDQKIFFLKSVEDSGRIEAISIGLDDGNYEIFLDMNGDEFKKFFAIIKSFKDLLYSEGLELNEEELEEADNYENVNESVKDSDIKTRTEEELNNLRMIENNKNNNKKEINSENALKPSKVITKDILKSINEVEPSVEKNNFYNEEDEENINLYDKKLDTENNDIDSDLDPKDWDPW